MKIKRRILTTLLATTLTITSLPIQLFAQEVTAKPLPIAALVDSQTTTSGAIGIKPSKYVGDGYEVEFKVTNKWPGAFNAEISITNNTEETIEDWTLEFDFDRNIERFWTAEIVGHQGKHYVIKNAGYNANIAPGQTITLGFAGNADNVDSEPENYVLDQIGSQIDYVKDSDGDLLPDWFEEELGTDPNKKDSDGDEITDYIEIYIIGTDPLKEDSDENGINDGDEDHDEDGLTNAEEIALGTKIHISDSDHDGLKDGEEVNVYYTSPIDTDTDEDNLTDYEEIILGLDPLNPKTDGITPDAERTFAQVLGNNKIKSQLLSNDQLILQSISGNISGLIDKKVLVETSDIKEYNDNRAVIGNVINIRTSSDEINLTLNYNISKVVRANGEIYAKDLVICKIGGEDGLIPIDTTYQDSSISADIHGGGNYLVINANDFLRNLGIDVLNYTEEAEYTTKSVDFSNETHILADKIGEDTNRGKWVILDDYQVVQLNDPIDDPDGDTDDDGIKDYDELGTMKSVSVEWAINKVLARCERAPSTIYVGKTSVDVYNYSTNPVLEDTDYDGINDNDAKDLIKRTKDGIASNTFAGKLYATFENGIDVDFKVDYRDFFDTKNTTYSKDLSVLSSIYSTIAYHKKLVIDKGTSISGGIKEIFEGFGLDNFDEYSLKDHYDDDDLSEVVLGHRLVEYNGEKKEIIVVAVRGTNSTVEEWSSNFDVGVNTGNYWDSANTYWRDKNNHKGFDVAANRLYDHIIEYINLNISKDAKKVIYIMGHSRGAAISNILGKKFEDNSNYESYTYTFACPNSTTSDNASSYSTIYNIVNSDDLIPELPLSNWDFTKYGQTYKISVEEYYEDSNPFGNKKGTFEWLTNVDYNNDGGTNRTLNAFGKIASNREDIYVYDYSTDGVVNPNNKYHITEKGALDELKKVKEELAVQRLDKYSTAYIDKGTFTYQVLVRYKPAFVMQVLANMTTGTGPILGYDVRGKYVTAKQSFVASSGKLVIGGMEHPHLQETYYLIATNNFEILK